MISRLAVMTIRPKSTSKFPKFTFCTRTKVRNCRLAVVNPRATFETIATSLIDNAFGRFHKFPTEYR
jgi:hypothetical protein